MVVGGEVAVLGEVVVSALAPRVPASARSAAASMGVATLSRVPKNQCLGLEGSARSVAVATLSSRRPASTRADSRRRLRV